MSNRRMSDKDQYLVDEEHLLYLFHAFVLLKLCICDTGDAPLHVGF